MTLLIALLFLLVLFAVFRQGLVVGCVSVIVAPIIGLFAIGMLITIFEWIL